MIKIKELHKEHMLVTAAYKMVEYHAVYSTMGPCLEDIMDDFPTLNRDLAICMWIAVNAKDRTDKGIAP